MVRDFHPERTDPRGLQKNQRALENLLHKLFDRASGEELFVVLAGRSGGQTILQGVTLEGGVVVNDLGADVDFRVESDTEPNALFVDGATGRVGIGTGSPSDLLHLLATGVIRLVVESSGASAAMVRLKNTSRSWRFEVSGAGNFAITDETAGTFPLFILGGAPSQSITIQNTGRLVLGPGSPRFTGRTATAADPTTTELPSDKDFGLHKNTSSGAVFLAYNDGGTIKKVALT